MGYTTGRELHPALKIVIQLRTIIISDIISVNKKFFSRLSKYNNLQAGKHRLFLNILLFGKLLQQTRKRVPACGGVGAPRPTHRLQVGCRAACPHAAADATAAVRFRGRIWNPPLRSCCRGRRGRPAGSCSLKSITSRYILYSFAEFCYNGSIPFIIGHFEGVIL